MKREDNSLLRWVVVVVETKRHEKEGKRIKCQL